MSYYNFNEQSSDNSTEKVRQYNLWKQDRAWEYQDMKNLHGDAFNWFLRNRYRPVATLDRRPAPPKPQEPQEPANGMSMNQAIQHDLFMCKNAGGEQEAAHRAAGQQVHTPCPYCSMEQHDGSDKRCNPPSCF